MRFANQAMKYLIAVALAVLVLVLAGCGTARASHPAAEHTAKSAATHTLTCQQQVTAWRANGPASANYDEMSAALSSIQHLDVSALGQGLVRVGNLAQSAEQWPFPVCADPQGDYSKGLSYLITAGDDAGSGTMEGLLSAVKAVHHAERLLGSVSSHLADYGVS